MRTEKTPGRECPHDVFGLRPHKGTMWMSNDRVPLENIESPYGGGVSSLPGATGDLLPVMFPVAPVLLTYPKQSALGVSLDSELMEGMSRPEPLEQSVLRALSVVQPDETDTPERPALASQMNHEQSRFKSSAGEFSSDDELDDLARTAFAEDDNFDAPEGIYLIGRWVGCQVMMITP